MSTSLKGQPTLFDPHPDEVKRAAAIALEKFRPTLEKYLSDPQYSCSGYWWWRSRWYEWVGYTHGDPHEVWKQKNDLELLFDDVWVLHEKEFSRHPNHVPHGLPADAR